MSASSQIPGSRFGTGNNSRPSSKDGPKKNIWSSMLDSVANGKRLPEKNLLILGAKTWLLLPSSGMDILLFWGWVANTWTDFQEEHLRVKENS